MRRTYWKGCFVERMREVGLARCEQQRMIWRVGAAEARSHLPASKMSCLHCLSAIGSLGVVVGFVNRCSRDLCTSALQLPSRSVPSRSVSHLVIAFRPMSPPTLYSCTISKTHPSPSRSFLAFNPPWRTTLSPQLAEGSHPRASGRTVDEDDGSSLSHE